MTAPLLAHSSYEEAFQSFLARGELRHPCCRACGAVLGYAARCCPQGHAQVAWKSASGGATLVSWTVYHQAYDARFPVPFVVGEVRLDEGPSVIAGLDAQAASLTAGQRLRLRTPVAGRLIFEPTE